jgi:hypothetical protein
MSHLCLASPGIFSCGVELEGSIYKGKVHLEVNQKIDLGKKGIKRKEQSEEIRKSRQAVLNS